MVSLIPIFLTILITEFGDRTQFATLLFAIDKQHHPLLVYAAVVSALAVSSALSVAIGHYAARYLEIIPFKLIAGICFILMGIWTIIEHYRAS